ncbi:MAG: hypothetical protein U0W24_16780 [Bacteroidales bacterium]
MAHYRYSVGTGYGSLCNKWIFLSYLIWLHLLILHQFIVSRAYYENTIFFLMIVAEGAGRKY